RNDGSGSVSPSVLASGIDASSSGSTGAEPGPSGGTATVEGSDCVRARIGRRASTRSDADAKRAPGSIASARPNTADSALTSAPGMGSAQTDGDAASEQAGRSLPHQSVAQVKRDMMNAPARRAVQRLGQTTQHDQRGIHRR